MIMVGCPIANRAEHVNDYINSLLALDYPSKMLRVVFLDHNSVDGTYESLKDKEYLNDYFYSFEVYREEEIPNVNIKNRDYNIYAAIRNKWINLRKDEDYVFSIDSDIRINKDSLKRLLSHKKDICSLLVRNAPKPHKIFNFMNYNEKGKLIRLQSFPNSLIKVDVTGACYLISRKVLDAGVMYGYDTRGEDIFFCNSAKEMGFNIYCDTSLEMKHILEVKGNVQ